jgi:hypothetical protein
MARRAGCHQAGLRCALTKYDFMRVNPIGYAGLAKSSNTLALGLPPASELVTPPILAAAIIRPAMTWPSENFAITAITSGSNNNPALRKRIGCHRPCQVRSNKGARGSKLGRQLLYQQAIVLLNQESLENA